MKEVKGFWLPDEDSYFCNCMDERGFQIDHLDLAMKHVTRFHTALDCGAHVGTWSCQMAFMFSHVYAFEPSSDTYECLQSNINLHGNGNVTACQFAIGDTYRKVSVVNDVKRIGNTGSRYIQEPDLTKKSDCVNMITIDSLELSCLDFLKLDLEGYEYNAILGGLQTIKKFKPVILVEEKGFNDRYGIDDKLATKTLLEIGAKIVDKIGKDYIFSF